MNRQLITYKSLLPVQRNPATSDTGYGPVKFKQGDIVLSVAI
jgi:hypothetical protein